ncbi:unnamed protein product [Cylicocyclus nassatus]|uniref:SGNH domain-containing protein n=1 Tax=Cylicocyclus nassatus TaxID=53992 RepID=A0AA36MDC2_CYLNA|nr:unnamed protein product [Cylicocyclus nassatus]
MCRKYTKPKEVKFQVFSSFFLSDSPYQQQHLIIRLNFKPFYLRAPPLESINRSTSKIEYAIEWNIRNARKGFDSPCKKDYTTAYAKFNAQLQWRCVAKGNGTANIMVIGNSVAQRAYLLIYEILKGRFNELRLFARNNCAALSNECPSFSEAMRKVVQHEKPDILFSMHITLAEPYVKPVEDLETDLIYNQFQSNVNFISNYTKYIVIDMPYYKYSNFNSGAVLARRLQRGLFLGDEFIITWQQYIDQAQHHRKRISSLVCNKCIINDVAEGLFQNGIFFAYDPRTYFARIGDGTHLTTVGIELLRPLYKRIIEKLLQELNEESLHQDKGKQ